LPFPGGPAVEKQARQGKPRRFAFPIPLKGREGCDFSFSGLKTAVRLAAHEVAKNGVITAQDASDICASFQYTVAEVLRDRMAYAFRTFAGRYAARTLVVAGGVAANQYLRGCLEELAGIQGFSLVVPPARLCTDNAAMIAWTGLERLGLGMVDGLDTEPRARWPLAQG